VAAVALSLSMAAAMACMAPRNGDPPAIVLGTTLPLSTADRAMAEAWHRGYTRAVADANRAGGVRLQASGRRVRAVLQVRDDGGDVAQAQEAAEALLSSGAHVLLGTPGAVRMAAQAAVAGRFFRPYVVPARYGPDLTATDRPWLFVARRDGETDEERAYQAARSAIAGLEAAATLDAEAVRRAFGEVLAR
jgi:ABC-type branched-subunit amino acid transport system substrate-binding protein